MSEATLNLYQKIVEVRKIAEGFSKDKSSYGYTYVSGNQVLGKIKDKMNELNLLLFPSTKMGEHHTHAYKTAKGKDVLDFVVKGEMSYTWIDGDNPAERETVAWAYYGQQDDISKAYGSALTYSERYYLLKSLGLPTDEDDPDAPKQKQEGNTGWEKPPEREQYKKSQEAKKETSTAETQTDKSLISPPQIGLTEKLKKQKKITDIDFNKMVSEISEGGTDIKQLTKKQASEFITLLTNYTMSDPFTGDGTPINISDDDLPF